VCSATDYPVAERLMYPLTDRREVGSATAWPLAARAQESDKRPTIGFLGADAAGWRPWTDAF